MRTVLPSVTNHLDYDRQVSGYIRLRDNRLRFSTYSIPADTTTLAPNVKSIDSANYSYGVLRVANINNLLYYHWIPNLDPSVPASGSWVTDGIQLMANSKPAVFSNYIFYQKPSGALYYISMSLYGTPPPPVERSYGGTYTGPVALAAVGSEELYVISFDGTAPYQQSKIEYRQMANAPQAWHGRVYSNEQARYKFTAVRHDSQDYIFVNDMEGNRAMVLTHMVGGAWGDLRPVMPLDVVDDHKYIVTGAASMGGYLYISGILHRETGTKFQFYSRGPAPFTAGRDIYIATTGVTETETYTDNNGTATLPMTGGKLHLVEDGLYNICWGISYDSDANWIVGYDPGSAYEREVTDINTIRVDYTINESARASFDLPAAEYNVDPLKPGSEFDIEIAYNDQFTKLGTFGIDAIAKQEDGSGQALSVTGRSLGLKSLSQWEPDVSFDLWSQTKQSCEPGDLKEMVRITGLWDTDGNGDLYNERLNEPGICYTAKRAARGSIVRAKFYNTYVSDVNLNGAFGIGINYYRGEDDNGDLQDNGIFAVYVSPIEAAAHIFIYHVVDGVWTMLTDHTIAVDFDTNAWCWMSLEFRDGHIIAGYRQDDDDEWITYPFNFINLGSPWPRDDVGRGAIYVENRTTHFVTPGVQSTATIIPCDPAYGDPAGGIIVSGGLPGTPDLIIDDEIFRISGTSPINYVDEPSGMVATDDEAWLNANHRNTEWIDHLVDVHEWDGNPVDTQLLCFDNTNKFVCRSFTVEGTMQIRSVKVPMKKTGTPPAAHCWIATDAFDDSTPPISGGTILGDASVAAANIGTNFAMVEFTFGTPITVSDDNFFIVLSNAAVGNWPTVDNANWYDISPDTDFDNKTGILLIWGDAGWHYRDDYALMAFEIYGDAVWRAGAYEIQVTGGPTGVDRDDFNDYALFVTEGTGKGTAFRILDYDENAPDDWRPNRSYLPPDNWEDHVGDGNHGEWIDNNRQRFFVLENPRGIIDEGSILAVYPCILISMRGENTGGSAATSHSADAVVSVYSTDAIKVERFEYYSDDIDLSLEDVAKNLARKAGVYNLSSQMDFSQHVTTTHNEWEGVEAVMTSVGAHQRNSAIVKFQRVSGSGFPGVSFGTDQTFKGGYFLLVTDTAIWLYNNIGSSSILPLALTEVMPMHFPYGASTEITVSINDGFCSVWMEDLLLTTFVLPTPLADLRTQNYLSFFSWNACSFNASLSASDIRIDNFIFDSGTRGSQLLSRLIGEKRIRFQDDNAGGIKLWKYRTAIPGTYNYTAMETINLIDTDMVTRLQAEGVEIVEVFDVENLAEHGNLFHVINLNEMNTAGDMITEATAILDETQAKISQRTITGAADPRCEPGDQISVALPEGTVDVNVDGVSFILSVSENEAMFDMEVTGHDA